MFFRFLKVLLYSGLLCAGICHGEEGMWTFDNPPLKLLQQQYGFTPSPQWLDHVRLSSVRLNDGGSGSFVSPHGLLLTNHHVAREQLQKNSTAQHDYIRDGFYAATPEQEIRSPDLEVNVLLSMENVTGRVTSAVKQAKTPAEEFAAREAAIAAIERESLQKTGLRSDVVALYQGGEYWLYRYKRYTDVRLVFAPEAQIAFFGGDSDNFTYPRYDIDFALFRVYENGKPINSKDYLKWNTKGAADNELVFVSGHPGSTARLDTLAQLEALRDVRLPLILKRLRYRLDVLKRYSAQGPEQARQAASLIFGLENSLKARQGQYQGLLSKRVMDKKAAEEADFRAKVMANPRWKAAYGDAWDEIAKAEKKGLSRLREDVYRELNATLATLATTIVQYVTEIQKPDGERLPGYHESELDSLRLQMFSPAPVYPELQKAILAGALEWDLSGLGPNDPFLQIVLNGRTPEQAAAELVKGTKLADPAFRRQLVAGGEAAVRASNDPMIVLARKIDPIRREMIRWKQQNVESVEQRAGEKLGKARFAVYGKDTYPDATFTLRLSYGAVKGYPMNGTKAPPRTTFYGLYDRALSFGDQGEFALPERYRKGREKLDLPTPLNFVTTNDIIGGNSGSPVINRGGEIVGLIFDGNIESLVGDFVYDGEANRAVAVHTGGITEVLEKLYGAGRLVRELKGQ
jgi:hypothetical protein